MLNTIEARSEFDEPDLVPSSNDEITHSELLCLYRDSEENIRFSKLLQWRSTGSTLVIFVVLALMARYYPLAGVMTKTLTILTFVVGAAALSMLAILQMWQGTEREKIHIIIGNL